MAIIANRVKNKNIFVQFYQAPLNVVKKFFAIILLSISFLMLYNSSSGVVATYCLEIVGNILELSSDFYQVINNSFQGVGRYLHSVQNLEIKNSKLQLENEKHKLRLQHVVKLETENEKLKEALNFIPKYHSSFSTGNIVGLSLNPLTCCAVINLGSKDDIQVDDIVKNNGYLLGRITKVSDNYSEVILVQDQNSRIPVVTSSSNEHGILASQDNHLKLIYLKEGHKVSVGELIYSSGDGLIYPRGIPVGKVVKVEFGNIYVEVPVPVHQVNIVVVEPGLKNINY